MEIFPRRGVELSADAEVLFEEPELERPAIIYRSENGFREARSLTSTSRWRFKVLCRVSMADWQTIVAFLDARALTVEPFTIHHPYLTGSEGATANYDATTLPSPRILRAGGESWFSFELPIIGQF